MPLPVEVSMWNWFEFPYVYVLATNGNVALYAHVTSCSGDAVMRICRDEVLGMGNIRYNKVQSRSISKNRNVFVIRSRLV